MSFWSTIGNVAKEAGKSVIEAGQKAQDYIIEWQDKDDNFLIRKAANGTMAEKTAAKKILRDRGYGS